MVWRFEGTKKKMNFRFIKTPVDTGEFRLLQYHGWWCLLFGQQKTGDAPPSISKASLLLCDRLVEHLLGTVQCTAVVIATPEFSNVAKIITTPT